MTNVHFTLISENSKIGPIPAAMSVSETCNKKCPFNTIANGGCYASYGPLHIHWKRLDDGIYGINWNEFTKIISKLPKNQLWRYATAGDLPGIDGKINTKELNNLVKANKKKRGFTYTHKNVINNKTNRKAIKSANEEGFTINLSANNLSHADKLYDLKIGPVVSVVSSDLERKKSKNNIWLETEIEYKARIGRIATPAGNPVIVCPTTYQDYVNCSNCGICATQRKAIVAFPAHGTAKRIANNIAINRVSKVS